MSIINEALKKAASKNDDFSRLASEPLKEFEKTAGSVQLDVQKKTWQRKKWLFFGGISGGLAASVLFISIFLGKDLSVTSRPRPTAIAQPAPEAVAAPAKYVRLPNLTLDGIVEGRGEPMAIINARIVKVGDNLQGASVVRINKESVLLVYEGQEFLLRIK